MEEGKEPLFVPFKGLTLTGILWILAPIFFLFYCRVRFAIAELLIFTTFFGFSFGILNRGLSDMHSEFPSVALWSYACLHFHAMAFSAILYSYRRPCYFRLTLFQTFPAALFLSAGLSFSMGSR